VRVLLQSSKALDVNGGDSDWRTPLMHAAAGGHEGVVELLLAHGARVDVTDRESRSALHWAVLHGRERVLRLMLEGAAETGVLDEVINSYDSAGWTPLHSAVHKGFEPGLLLLLEFGANQAFMARKCPYANEKEAGDSSDQ
jgi:ankyrin repeat protein